MGEAQFDEEEMSKVIIKDGMTKQAKNQALNLSLNKILAKRNDNLKTTLKWCWKMNVHARILRCSPKDDSFVSLIIVQMLG